MNQFLILDSHGLGRYRPKAWKYRSVSANKCVNNALKSDQRGVSIPFLVAAQYSYSHPTCTTRDHVIIPIVHGKFENSLKFSTPKQKPHVSNVASKNNVKNIFLGWLWKLQKFDDLQNISKCTCVTDRANTHCHAMATKVLN